MLPVPSTVVTPPPFSPGQRQVLAAHYAANGAGPVAFVDETYSVDPSHAERFYVMTAVVVRATERDGLRDEVDRVVPSGWWHTTDALKQKRFEEVEDLLACLDPRHEVSVLVHNARIEDAGHVDETAEVAREACLGALMLALYSGTQGAHEPVRLVVMEERRTGRQNNRDRRTRAGLVAQGLTGDDLRLSLVSPGSDHLLWLPDVVCSAYRQKILLQDSHFFEQVQEITHLIHL